MTEVKHTKGPFVAKKFGYEKYGIYDERGTDIGFAHRERDATLFAATPELMEVVRAMASFDGRNNNAHLKEMARSAIAKAEGRA